MKWFFGLPKEIAQTEDYKEVKTLHANFHKIAREILGLALAGKKDEALVLALRAWRGKL